MTAPDAARGGTGSPEDSIQGLAGIVSRGQAAVTVLIGELRSSLNSPIEVRPMAEPSEDEWGLQVARALGEVRGSVLAVTAEQPVLAAHLALGLASRLVETGAPVTVVDGSIEDPVFAKGLPEDGDEGLVDAVLFGVSSSTVARRTLLHGVRLVTAGSYPISVPAVLSADAYRTTLEKLAREDATVIVVLPAAYAPVAAGVASQLIIVERDLPALDRLTRDLRRDDELRDVRFVAVLSTDEQIPIEDASAASVVPPEVAGVEELEEQESVEAAGVDEPEEQESVEAAGVDEPEEQESVEAAGGEGVTRTPALVTANAAFAADVAPTDSEEESVQRKRSSGGSWGGWIAVIVILLIAGVVWRMGILDPLFGDENEGPVEIAAVDEREPSAVDSAALSDSATVNAAPSELAASTVSAAGEPVAGDGGDAQAADAGETAVHDWRAAAVSAAVPGRYVVFTTSHKHPADAELAAATLERRGFPSVVVDVDIPERGRWHRVAVDAGFRTLDDTRELLDIMKEVGYEGAWVERLRELAPPAVATPDTSHKWIDDNGAPQ